MLRALILWIVLFFTGAVVHAAEAPPSLVKIVRAFSLKLPVDCKIGTDCWVLNYPDVGMAKDGTATDPACLAQTYDEHKGTDIAIADKAAMDKGVDVLAAHDGTVKIVRDSVDDHFPLLPEELAKIKADKKECGNAVLIDHGEGWQTMYCHLKRGSIAVKQEQKVKAGDRIAQIGSSGMTQFPHLHIGVIKGKDVMDPFTGKSLTDACSKGGKSLFDKTSGIAYKPLSFVKLGFKDTPVKIEELDLGQETKEIKTDAKALVFYSMMYGLRAGDEVSLKLESPDGSSFAERKLVQDKNRARQLLFVGRNVPKSENLPAGIYTGKVTVTRIGKEETPETYSQTKSINIKDAQ